MKIIINQKTLANKIGIAQKAINSKTTIELLKGILWVAKNDQLKITGYDAEIGIETYTQAEVQEEGEIVVDARLFGDIIRKLPDSFVELETDNENNIYINCVNSKFKIKGYPAKEFPKLPDVEDGAICDIPQELLKNMIKQTVFAISQDQTKPILMGELLEIQDGNISLVAIDGYRLAVRTSNFENPIQNVKVIIPGKTLIDVNSLLTSEESIGLGFNEKNAVFMIKDTKIITRLLEGDFIDYKKLLPKEYNTKVKLNTRDLLDSIERASLLAREDKNNLIILDINNENMQINSASEYGNAEENIPVEKQGEDIKIGFNSKYVLDVLKVIDNQYITMNLIGKNNPCFIKEQDNENYIYMILPVRIS